MTCLDADHRPSLDHMMVVLRSVRYGVKMKLTENDFKND